LYYFEIVPEDLVDRDIVKTAWKSGNDVFPSDFPEALKTDKGFILELIATTPCRDIQGLEYFIVTGASSDE
jgi:hypothetical protein